VQSKISNNFFEKKKDFSETKVLSESSMEEKINLSEKKNEIFEFNP